MANFSADSVVTAAQTWRQDTNGRLGLTFETEGGFRAINLVFLGDAG